MAYTALTFFLLLCVALVRGSDPGGDSVECEGARAVYQLFNNGEASENSIYHHMKDSEGPSMCRLSKTCCSSTAEHELLVSKNTEVKERVLEVWTDARSTCNNKLFKDSLSTFINESKASLVELLTIAYPGFFDRLTLFDEFYNYLIEAVMTTNSCEIGKQFNKLFFEVFLAFLDAHPSIDVSLYPENDPEFNSCLYNVYLETSSEDIHLDFIALTRSFNRTLYYIRALNAAEDLLNRLVELEFTPQCKQALMRLTACAQCSGLASTVTPCEDMCLNVLGGCLVDYSDIVDPFNKFLSALINMKEYLATRVDPFQHIGQLVNGIFDETTKLQRDASIIETKILVRCVGSNQRRRRTTTSQPQDSPFRRSLFPRSTVPPPSGVFNNSAYCFLGLAPLFDDVPDQLCQELSGDSDRGSCWNGNSLGRYNREVIPFDRYLQQDNPEMVVCPVLPMSLRIGLAQLERVTLEMNIITRSESCPEDDEDCQVDESRCDLTGYFPVPVNSSPHMPQDDDEGNGGSVSGSGCTPSGSGFGFGSGDCTDETTEVDECLIEPIITVSTVSTVSAVSTVSTVSTVPPSIAPSITVAVSTTTTTTAAIPSPSLPTKEPPIIIDIPDSSITCLPSSAVLLLSLIFSSVLLWSML